MLSFFFIPATKLNKIDLIKSRGIDEVIIDFEDAILENDRGNLLLELQDLNDHKNLWYRIPVRNSFLDNVVKLGFLKSFLNLGIKKIVLPKIKSSKELTTIFDNIKNYKSLQFIILIEHPRLLIEFNQILQYSELENAIAGIGLGAHDLMTFMFSEYSEKQLFYPRMQTLYLAKAYGKRAIDIASMNISDKEKFEEELLFGLEYGFDGKFLIHPKQHDWLKNFKGLKVKQIEWAQKILASLPPGYKGNEVEPFIVDGQIIEKTHIEKAQTILKKYNGEK